MAQKTYKPASSVKTAGIAKPAAKAADVRKPGEVTQVNFVFDKSNYRLMIISIAIVAFGFILMSGTTDIYSDTKIVIAPLVVLAGFAVGFLAIFKKPVNG